VLEPIDGFARLVSRGVTSFAPKPQTLARHINFGLTARGNGLLGTALRPRHRALSPSLMQGWNRPAARSLVLGIYGKNSQSIIACNFVTPPTSHRNCVFRVRCGCQRTMAKSANNMRRRVAWDAEWWLVVLMDGCRQQMSMSSGTAPNAARQLILATP